MFETTQHTKPQQPEMPEKHDKAPRPTSFDVHVMPSQFHLGKPKKDDILKPGEKKSKTGKYMLIAVAAVVVIGLGIIGVLVYQRGANKELANSNTNANTNTVQLNFNTNKVNANSNTNANTNTNANSNTNAANRNTNTSVALTFDQLTSTADADKDNVTDIEEASYTSKLNSSDSDDDTFLDGAEVLMGYSPVGKGRLDGTSIISVYNNLNYGFSFIYPKTWSLQQRGEGKLGVIVTSPAGDEYIDVSVQENVGRLTPAQWYLQQATTVNTSPVTEIQNTNKKVVGVRSLDGLSYHFGSGNYIYTFYYGTGTKKSVDYKTTFQMVSNSIDILPPTAISNSNTNTNNNTNVNSNSNTSSNANTNTNSNTNAVTNTNSNVNTNTNTNSNSNTNANTNS